MPDVIFLNFKLFTNGRNAPAGLKELIWPHRPYGPSGTTAATGAHSATAVAWNRQAI
jgi:hypothetical protein